MRECLKPLLTLWWGERTKGVKLPADDSTLCRKPEVIVNHFAQQAGHKAQRQLSQYFKMSHNQLSRSGRITRELINLEIVWHHSYSNSRIVLPCDSLGENPIIAPRVGTRSIDCTGRSYTTPWRTPVPKAIIHVVRDAVSPVR